MSRGSAADRDVVCSYGITVWSTCLVFDKNYSFGTVRRAMAPGLINRRFATVSMLLTLSSLYTRTPFNVQQLDCLCVYNNINSTRV